MNHNVRVTELPTQEVYIDVNDLIIELLSLTQSASTEAEKRVYKDLVDRLSSIRDKAHKTGKHVHTQKF